MNPLMIEEGLRGMTPEEKVQPDYRQLEPLESIIWHHEHKIILATCTFKTISLRQIQCLYAAKQLGGVLFVGLKQMKGETAESWKERALLLAYYRFVNFVFKFDNESEFIRLVKPNIFTLDRNAKLAKGKQLERAKLAAELSCQIITIDPKR